MSSEDFEFQVKTLALALIVGNVPLVRNRYKYSYESGKPEEYSMDDDWTSDPDGWDQVIFDSRYYSDQWITEEVLTEICSAIKTNTVSRAIPVESISSALNTTWYKDGTFDDGSHEGENMIVNFTINGRPMVLTFSYPGMTSSLAALEVLPAKLDNFSEIEDIFMDRLTSGWNNLPTLLKFKTDNGELEIWPSRIKRFGQGRVTLCHASEEKQVKGSFLTNRI